MDETKGLTEQEWQRLSGVTTWSAFLQLPWELQQRFRKALPTVAEQLERKHFATMNRGVPYAKP